MSGTSVDGIDAVCCEFKPDGMITHGAIFQDFDLDLQNLIHELCQNNLWPREKYLEADVRLGEAYAKAVLNLIDEFDLDPSQIGAVGCHGQTIFHHPEGQYRSSFQIGDPHIIAARTNLKVIFDFRRRDIAEGGQGAPLVPVFHEYLLRKKDQDRIIVNLGGLANISVLTQDSPLLGYDTGPGNTLIDAYCRLNHLGPCDFEGQKAKQGRVQEDWLKKLLDHDYFLKPSPKSCGREIFNLDWALSFNQNFSHEDALATLSELTVESLARAIKTHTQKAEIILCGGGARNLYLSQGLERILGNNFLIKSADQLGLNISWIEAQAFAYFAMRTVNQESSNCPSVTGAKRAVVLGAVC